MASINELAAGPIGQALARAAAVTGTDFAALLETASRESSLNPAAKAATSSAAGLFQFIESTWLEMVARHGGKHGLDREAASIELSGGRARVADPARRAEILALRHDPELSARLAGELTRENADHLARALGRPAQAGEVYAAHVLGAGGAVRLIRAAEAGAADASALFPREAAANRGLFYDKQGAARSAEGLLARLGAAAPASASVAASAPAQDFVEWRAADGPEAMLGALLAHVLGLEGLGLDEDRRATPELRLLATEAYQAAFKRFP